MTECERYQEFISRMADEELAKSERAALSAHMEHCSQCNTMYAVFSNLSEIIGQDTEPLPEGLHENIMADIRRSAIKQQNIKERRRFAIPKPFRNVIAAAACAAISRMNAPASATAKRALSTPLWRAFCRHERERGRSRGGTRGHRRRDAAAHPGNTAEGCRFRSGNSGSRCYRRARCLSRGSERRY